MVQTPRIDDDSTTAMIETERYDPGEPHPGVNDTIDIEWVDRGKELAGLLRLSVRPDDRTTWFLCAVHQRGHDPVVVLDWELPLVTNAFEFRASGIWTDFVCETPIEQWTIGLEAFGVAIDSAETLTPDVYGQRLPVGLDLDVEAASAPDESDNGFCHDVSVCGEVLVGSESWEIEALGRRRRYWAEPAPGQALAPAGLALETRISVLWPGSQYPEARGWVRGARPGWVDLPI